MPEPHHSIFYRPDALPAAQPIISHENKAKSETAEVVSVNINKIF